MAYDGTTPQKNFWIRFAAQDRVTLLPDSLVAPLQEHLQYVKRLHEDDLARDCGAVHLPEALERKYPHANEEWAWQYVFPSQRLSVDPRSDVVRRHHLNESGLQKSVRKAARHENTPIVRHVKSLP